MEARAGGTGMKLNYFYRKEADKFSFFRIPRLLFTDDEYADLSVEAKVLYGLLLDAMSLSAKNKWIDEKNRVFILYPINQIQEYLGVSKGKAIDCLQELEEIGLIEKRQQGQGKPACIYVKSFLKEQSVANMF